VFDYFYSFFSNPKGLKIDGAKAEDFKY